MLDVVAFSEIAGRAGTVALQNVAGLADTHVSVAGDNVTVPSPCNKILAVYAGSCATAGSLTNAVQISSPSLRATSLLDLPNFEVHGLADAPATIFPCNLADNTGGIDTYMPAFNDFKESPIELVPGEFLQCLTAVDVAAAGESARVILFLTDNYNIVQSGGLTGRIETVIADGVAAAVAGVWSPTALVFRQALRAGTYALVGMKAASTTMVAARLVFGNQGTRPGCLGVNTLMQSQDPALGLFRYGRLGIWGTFMHNTPPVAEILCAAADAAAVQHFAFDVIKIA